MRYSPDRNRTVNSTFVPQAAFGRRGIRFAFASLLALPILFITGCVGGVTSSTGSHGNPSAAGHSVTLAWSAATSEVAAYNVYRSESISGPYQKLKTIQAPDNQFVDPGVAAGVYYYVVTSVGADGVESANSVPAVANIPF